MMMSAMGYERCQEMRAPKMLLPAPQRAAVLLATGIISEAIWSQRQPCLSVSYSSLFLMSLCKKKISIRG